MEDVSYTPPTDYIETSVKIGVQRILAAADNAFRIHDDITNLFMPTERLEKEYKEFHGVDLDKFELYKYFNNKCLEDVVLMYFTPHIMLFRQESGDKESPVSAYWVWFHSFYKLYREHAHEFVAQVKEERSAQRHELSSGQSSRSHSDQNSTHPSDPAPVRDWDRPAPTRTPDSHRKSEPAFVATPFRNRGQSVSARTQDSSSETELTRPRPRTPMRNWIQSAPTRTQSPAVSQQPSVTGTRTQVSHRESDPAHQPGEDSKVQTARPPTSIRNWVQTTPNRAQKPEPARPHPPTAIRKWNQSAPTRTQNSAVPQQPSDDQAPDSHRKTEPVHLPEEDPKVMVQTTRPPTPICNSNQSAPTCIQSPAVPQQSPVAGTRTQDSHRESDPVHQSEEDSKAVVQTTRPPTPVRNSNQSAPTRSQDSSSETEPRPRTPMRNWIQSAPIRTQNPAVPQPPPVAANSETDPAHLPKDDPEKPRSPTPFRNWVQFAKTLTQNPAIPQQPSDDQAATRTPDPSSETEPARSHPPARDRDQSALTHTETSAVLQQPPVASACTENATNSETGPSHLPEEGPKVIPIKPCPPTPVRNSNQFAPTRSQDSSSEIEPARPRPPAQVINRFPAPGTRETESAQPSEEDLKAIRARFGCASKTAGPTRVVTSEAMKNSETLPPVRQGKKKQTKSANSGHYTDEEKDADECLRP